ncbi:hypothetical protein pb186bvf_006735 [Paramecium bursaria]
MQSNISSFRQKLHIINTPSLSIQRQNKFHKKIASIRLYLLKFMEHSQHFFIQIEVKKIKDGIINRINK